METLVAMQKWIVFGALTATVLAWIVAVTGGHVARAWRGARPVSRGVFVVGVALMALYGGSKGRVYFPQTDPEVRYLTDAGSTVSNDFVRVAFTRNVLVPETANLFVDACSVAYTNAADITAHTFGVYSNVFSAVQSPFNVPYANATNYNWFVYTDWTPPPVVHTNGVAYVVWQQATRTNVYAMTRTGLYREGYKIAPLPAITNGPPIVMTVPTTTTTTTTNENENQP